MTRCTIAAGLLAAAGAAHAAPELLIETDDFGGVQSTIRVGEQAPEQVFDADFALTNPRTYTVNESADPADLGPGIDSVFVNGSFTSEFSSTAVSLSSSMTGAVVTNDLYDPSDDSNFASAVGQALHSATITLTDNALVRIRITGSVDTNIANTDFGHRVVLSGASLSEFVVGFEDNTTSQPTFDAIVALDAGSYSWEYTQQFGDFSALPPVDGYFWDTSLGFSFEIVPAPGAAAIFGLGGLALTRRRR